MVTNSFGKIAYHNLRAFRASRSLSVPLRRREDDSTPRRKIVEKLAASNWNIPNALTVGRIVLTPLVCSALLAGEHQTAAGLFFTAGALDFLDGWAARALKQTSVLGSFLDPLADKVLISSSFVCCGITGLLPLWAIVPALARDAALLGGGLYFRWATKPKNVGFFDFGDASSPAMEPTQVSKANTALQLGAVAAAIATAATGVPGEAATLVIAGSMTCTTLFSTWEYYRDWGSVAKLQARTAAWQAKEAQEGGEMHRETHDRETGAHSKQNSKS